MSMVFRRKKKPKEDEVFTIPEDLKERAGVDKKEEKKDEDELLNKLERLCTNLLISSNGDVKEKALKMFCKVKLIKAGKGTLIEDMIKLYVGMKLSDDKIEELKRLNLIEEVYRITGNVNMKVKDKEEIFKKIEQMIKKEFDVREDIKMLFEGYPFKVNEEKSEIAGKLYELGIFEIYMLPKGWLNFPCIKKENVNDIMKEIDELIKSLPPHFAKFLKG